MKINEFVAWIYPQAKKLGEISPTFVTAQAALESGWGKAAIGNNLFGITKGSKWTGAVRLVTTTEYFSSKDVKFSDPEQVMSVVKLGEHRYKYTVKRLFRDYANVAQCLSDHTSTLKYKCYADAWPYRSNPRIFVRKLQDSIGSKYATSPDYVHTMDSIIATVERVVSIQKL